MAGCSSANLRDAGNEPQHGRRRQLFSIKALRLAKMVPVRGFAKGWSLPFSGIAA
jgi:hypothetical protein